MDQWLIRTSQNWIAGPYLKEQVRQMILEGKLTLQDEVCEANGFWIFLHERDEVQSQLNMEVPRAKNQAGEEVTEGLTRGSGTIGSDEDRTDPEIAYHKLDSDQKADSSESEGENTAVLSIASLREIRPVKKKLGVREKRGQTPFPSRTVEAKGQIEGPSFWRGFAWLLVIAGCVLVAVFFWKIMG